MGGKLAGRHKYINGSFWGEETALYRNILKIGNS